MLASVDSRELTQWLAFEREHGTLQYSDEVLAGIHEQLQCVAHLLGAAHFTDDKHTKNPVPEPERIPRPGEPVVLRSAAEPEEDWNPEEDPVQVAKDKVTAIDALLGFTPDRQKV